MSSDIYCQDTQKIVGVSGDLIKGAVMEHSGNKNTKVDCNSRSYFGCANCGCTLRSIETFRRADGNVLQLIICDNCNHKWKEIWLCKMNSN